MSTSVKKEIRFRLKALPVDNAGRSDLKTSDYQWLTLYYQIVCVAWIRASPSWMTIERLLLTVSKGNILSLVFVNFLLKSFLKIAWECFNGVSSDCKFENLHNMIYWGGNSLTIDIMIPKTKHFPSCNCSRFFFNNFIVLWGIERPDEPGHS